MLRSAVNRNPIRMQQNNEVLEQLDLGEELGDCELMISEKLSVFYGQQQPTCRSPCTFVARQPLLAKFNGRHEKREPLRFNRAIHVSVDPSVFARAEDSSIARCKSSSNEGFGAATTSIW